MLLKHATIKLLKMVKMKHRTSSATIMLKWNWNVILKAKNKYQWIYFIYQEPNLELKCALMTESQSQTAIDCISGKNNSQPTI
jgi:hypothetical protein